MDYFWRRLPSKHQIKTLPKLLSETERRVLITLAAVAIVSLLAALITIDRVYSTPTPANGGSLTEGMLGSPLRVNPILALSDADRDLASLVYAGLLRPDGNGGVKPELAESYEVSDDGLTYTFVLRDHLSWHDGEKLTTDDIAFTVEAAKNPIIASPKRANWEGIETAVVDDRTITFTLRRPYAPFLFQNATMGILPKHLWGELTSQEFTQSEYNREPIGAGPYRVADFNENSNGGIERYTLKAFRKYQPERAHISKLTIIFFSRTEDLSAAYRRGDIDALAVSPDTSEEIAKNNDIEFYQLALPHIVAIFFNDGRARAFTDMSARTALERAIDRGGIIKDVLKGYATAQTGPLVNGETEVPASASNEDLRDILKNGGWKEKDNGWSKKIGNQTVPLAFTIATADTSPLPQVAEALKKSWEAIGVRVTVEVFESEDLIQAKIRPRDYDALLIPHLVGFQPDPYAFWHSSQRAYPGSNLALYANPKADTILEKLRTNVSAEERTKLEDSFTAMIAKDRPAVFLYSPSYLYAADKRIQGISRTTRIAFSTERFADIAEWYRYTRNRWNFVLR